MSRVVVTACGSVVGEGIIKCLNLSNSKRQNRKYDIIAVDMSPLAPGLYRSFAGSLVPSPGSPAYLDTLIRICNKYGAEAVFVGSDEELPFLANTATRMREESGVYVVSNSPEIMSIGTDKWKTFEFLKREGLPCAESALPSQRDDFTSEYGFPIVVKPRVGHGSENFFIVNNDAELSAAIATIERSKKSPVLQEYLDARDSEFTTGVTMDKDGQKVLSSISIRRILKHGQTYKAFIQDYPTVRRAAEDVAMRLAATGPINIQCRMVDGVPKTFEINPRFSASCPMRATAGVNEPDIIFSSHMLGESVQQPTLKELVCLRYWNELYVPYDSFTKVSESGEVRNAGAFVPDYF